MDNLQGLVVDEKITEATGTSERDAAFDMLQMVSGSGRITVGADRGYDTRDFVWDCRDMRITRGPETTLGDRWTDHPARRTQVGSAGA